MLEITIRTRRAKKGPKFVGQCNWSYCINIKAEKVSRLKLLIQGLIPIAPKQEDHESKIDTRNILTVWTGRIACSGKVQNRMTLYYIVQAFIRDTFFQACVSESVMKNIQIRYRIKHSGKIQEKKSTDDIYVII